jgi:hypothetical protein
MRKRFNPSLVVASVALFMALGGPAWAAGLISGSEIKNGSITSNKIGRGQVRAANLAAGSVTASTVARGALTAADIAPNTFLAANGTAANSSALGGVPASGFLAANGTAANSSALGGVPASGFLAANGTAANSSALGGVPASGFVRGTGNMLQNRIDIRVGASSQFLLDVGLGEVDASCMAGDVPEVSFTAQAQPLDLIEWGTLGSTSDINPLHGMLIGSTFTESDTSVLKAIEFQVAQNLGTNSGQNRVATIWTTGDASGGTDCIFTAQALTTGV